MQTTIRNTAILAIAAASATTVVHAQSLPDGVTVRGTIELEYLRDSDGDNNQLIFGDMDLSYRPSSGPSSLGFGADLGLTGLATTDTSYSAIYAAVVLTTLWGDYSVGVPRTAFDQRIDLPPLLGSRFFDTELAAIAGGKDYLSAVYLLGGNQIYGLRYDGSFGALDVSASLHDADNLDGYAFQIAGNYKLGNGASLLAGYERIDTGSGDLNNVIVGATVDANRVDGGLVFSRLSSPGPDGSSARGYLGYDVTESLNLRGEVVHFDGGSLDQTIYGVGAEYTLPGSGAYIQGGIIDSKDTDPLLDATLGFKF